MSVDEIIDNLYKPRAERDENHQHIALLKAFISINHPPLSPTNTLTDELADKWGS